MEKAFNEMREYLLTHLEINKEVLKKVKKESVDSTYNQYWGELSLALYLELITREEFNDFESKLLRVYSVRNCIPEEEQETFEIEDLPFPEVMDKSPEEFIEIPEENVLPFPGPEVEPEEEEKIMNPVLAAEYVKEQFAYWLNACRKPNGCDEEHLNYLHGYFTMAGELGAVTMHRAEDMVHELTHECDKAKTEEPDENLIEDKMVMELAEKLQAKIIKDDALSSMFFDTFGRSPELAQFMPFIDCSGNVSLIYINETDTVYFINVRESSKNMLEIVAQRSY